VFLFQNEIAKCPIEKLKFVCHDKQDSSHFAAILQVPASSSSQKFIMLGLQAEKPVVGLASGCGAKEGGGGWDRKVSSRCIFDLKIELAPLTVTFSW